MKKLFTFFENSKVFFEINVNDGEMNNKISLSERLKELNIETYWDLTTKLKEFFEIKSKPQYLFM